MTFRSPLPLAHVAENLSWSAPSVIAFGAAAVFAIVLGIEHTYVKHGRLGLGQLRTVGATVVAVAMAAVVAPATGFAQDPIGPMGLPDLVSDPPFIWIEQVRTHPVDDEIMRVIAFDGMLHNIGTGALDVTGNPQEPDGMKQRVFDGEQWEEVGEPWVQFETDDGHNHFHLMNAASYTLWNEARTEQVEIGAKVGFCLIDSYQVERGVDSTYGLDETRYCNVDDPDSTFLNMGISPGWVDIYEASLTFQWVDVSNTLPGRYWVGAEIDPTNQILESNEDNNGLVFSANKYAVSGYNARPLSVQTPGQIALKSTVYGTVGPVAYVIVDPPAKGTLSVPTGVDVLHDTIEYRAEPGFTGTDSFSYYAHDTTSAFPFDPAVVTVQIDVDEATQSTDADEQPGDGTRIELVPGQTAVEAARYDRITVPVELRGDADGNGDAAAVWYAQNLPTGLTIDPETGVIEGELAMPVDQTSRIVALVDGVMAETEIEWIVQDGPQASLRHVGDFSTIMDRRDITVGEGTAETTYDASGLPEGVILTEGQPSLIGEPLEAGDFDVTVNEYRDGQLVDTMSFTLTVRPSVRPAFVL